MLREDLDQTNEQLMSVSEQLAKDKAKRTKVEDQLKKMSSKVIPEGCTSVNTLFVDKSNVTQYLSIHPHFSTTFISMLQTELGAF